MESKEYEQIGMLVDENKPYAQIILIRNGEPEKLFIIPIVDKVGWYKDIFKEQPMK